MIEFCVRETVKFNRKARDGARTPWRLRFCNASKTGKFCRARKPKRPWKKFFPAASETPEIVSLLRAMNARPIEPQELAGFASVMRRHAAPVFSDERLRPAHLIDTCGTGGDGCDTFNISTAAAIVASAAGASVAKHGNRAASSRCGSADVLEALGVRIDIPLERCGEAIREIGLGFLFAQAAHSATRHATLARKQIGERTAFNLLGPLTNPAGAHSQLVGVYSVDVIDLMAATLAELGVQRAFVVHGADGLDEISLSGETYVAELQRRSRQALHPHARGFRHVARSHRNPARRHRHGKRHAHPRSVRRPSQARDAILPS